MKKNTQCNEFSNNLYTIDKYPMKADCLRLSVSQNDRNDPLQPFSAIQWYINDIFHHPSQLLNHLKNDKIMHPFTTRLSRQPQRNIQTFIKMFCGIA